jgi:uncharacterized membrane-anchored protein
MEYRVKKIILIGMTLIILVLFNYEIYQKENIKKSNDIVYLELVPIDPRSLIQGDYVEFAYALGRHHQCTEEGKSGYVVITVNEKRMGTFARCYQGETVQSHERLLHYHQQGLTLRILPDSFLFQEGLAARYQQAKYGIFKFSGNKDYLLVGLADDKLQSL